MNFSRDYQRLRRAHALMLLGLAMLGIWRSPLRAEESGIQFSLTTALESETFREFVPQSADEIDETALIADDAFALAAYSEQGSADARRRGSVRVGYDGGFVIASPRQLNLNACDAPFLMRFNGWGQLRHTNLASEGPNPDVNQFQLTRGRLIFSGHAFTPDFAYYIQLDGRSSSGDDMRLLDYALTYDIGHHLWDWEEDVLVFNTGKYKMPFSLARWLSSREFEFTDRSMASMFFDVNRSLAWGLGGNRTTWNIPWNWELAIFNGLVTGGAETGSSGQLDNNFAYSGRIFTYPIGEWCSGELADFAWHETLAMRTGMAFANSTIDSFGTTEFDSARVVDSGATLASILPGGVSQYTVNLYAVDTSLKWRGWSTTLEYYFRYVTEFEGAPVDSLFDHGFWFQLGKFVVPGKLELLTRWSRVAGNSGTLGMQNQSSDAIAGGVAWYIRDQHAKLTVDATHLDGAPISSSSLDISPGDRGWLFRGQVQFAF